jgi:hypothetical protein
MVVSDAVFAMTPQERSTVLGVVTYGNPHFTPFINGATMTVLPMTLSVPAGIAGPRPAYPDGVASRSRDFCRSDIVCTVGGNYFAHTMYVNPGPDVSQGALFLANRIGINP